MENFSKFVADFLELGISHSFDSIVIDSDCVRFKIHVGVLHYDLLSHLIAVSNRYSLDLTIFALDDCLVLKFF